ncbi:MAG: hypothetical protein B7Z73_01880 [Planctomycetia bacterium 21-64-5]|nr:MAG: hypothetical protein B7Z73_01880 [Planctomycetia bacterium 21-64-5]
MSLNLTTFFQRLGCLLGRLNESNVFAGTTIPNGVLTLQGFYDSADRNVIDGADSWVSAAPGLVSGYQAALQSYAQQTLTQMATEADPLPSAALTTALYSLIAQMVAQSATVQAGTPAVTVTAGSGNIGSAVCAATVSLGSGRLAENAFAETIAGAVTADAQTGGATAGQETLTFLGQIPASGALAHDYPAGSGCTLTCNAVNAQVYSQGGAGNWLTDGDFEATWTANVPAGWHVLVGTAGTQVLQSTAVFFDGAASLQIAGDGSTLTAIYQGLTTPTAAGDTTAKVGPNALLAVNFWAKTDATPLAGQLTVDLCDGSGTALLDAQGNPSGGTLDLTTLGTGWAAHTFWLRTPRALPAAVRLRFRLSTALSSGTNLFLDRISLTAGNSLYAQGPSLAVFAGLVPLITGDTFTPVVTNTPGGMQGGADRFFGMKALGLLLPSSGTPSVSDSLIV